MGRKTHRSGVTLPPMKTHNVVLVAALTACGPIDIGITTTSGGEGGEISGTSAATEGLGVSETGAPSTVDSGDADCHVSSTGGGSSSTSEGSSGGSSTGELPPVCQPVDTNGDGLLDACECDGVPAPHDACFDCTMVGDYCFCNGENKPWPVEFCLQCFDPATGTCSCDVFVDATGACYCGDAVVLPSYCE